jgi:hypothetical protein
MIRCNCIFIAGCILVHLLYKLCVKYTSNVQQHFLSAIFLSLWMGTSDLGSLPLALVTGSDGGCVHWTPPFLVDLVYHIVCNWSREQRSLIGPTRMEIVIKIRLHFFGRILAPVLSIYKFRKRCIKYIETRDRTPIYVF